MDRAKYREFKRERMMDVYKLIKAGNRHRDKKIWSVNDLASVYPDEKRESLARFIRRQSANGILRPLMAEGRCTGWYFPDNPPDIFEAALFLDPGAVISSLSALSRHGVTDQISYSATCVTRAKRGGRVYTPIATTVGNVEFYHQPDRIMDLEPEGAHPDRRLASAEKALLDHIYIYRNRNRGRSPDLDEIDIDALDQERLRRYSKRYPGTVWKTLKNVTPFLGKRRER